MKRLNITENERERIISLHNNNLNEQYNGYPFHRAVQKFLNDKYKANLTVDGQLYKTGSDFTKSQEYIERYQNDLNKFIRIKIDVDGRFGDDTKMNMPDSDWKKLTDFYNQEKTWLDPSLKRYQ